MGFKTPSGTRSFAPFGSDIALGALERCGIFAPEKKHMFAARRSLNLLLVSDWANRGINLWDVDANPTVVNLLQGVATYPLTADVVAMLDTYVRIPATGIDTFMTPISRNDYAMQSNKLQQGRPSTYWFNRQVEPSITVWEVPDQNGPYQLQTYLMRQTMDASLSGGETLALPQRLLYAAEVDLARDLSMKFAVARYSMLKAAADEAWDLASEEDVEHVTTSIMPNFPSVF